MKKCHATSTYQLPQFMHPSADGVKHLNIYSKGLTVEGRAASNFAQANVCFPTRFGKFRTLEGLYHFLRLYDYCVYTAGPNVTEKDVLSLHKDVGKLYEVDGAEAIRLGRSIKADVYGGSNYAVGEFSKVATLCFMDALVDKLYLIVVEGGQTLGNRLSQRSADGLVFTHYYLYDGKVVYPKYGEWLPDLLKDIVCHIDPYALTFDRDEVKRKIRLYQDN